MISDSDQADVGVYRENGVLRLRLQCPQRRNSLSHEMMATLIGAIENAPDDESIRVILIEGEGDHFCGGADWVAINATDKRPRTGAMTRRLPRQAHRLIPALLRVQLPIVCSIRGWAAGIGCHLALASDFAIAGESARFWEPFAKRGFTPDSGGTWLLPRLIGLARAKEMLLLGREVGARQAEEWGLIHRCVPDADLETSTRELVEELATAATTAVGLTKWAVQSSLQLDLEHALANEGFTMELSSRSLDFKEGLAAFRDKRAPRFEGR
ncbi:enoyl-CoA hydratase-related protein [Myxococcota bacterium]|nr:enoyl-CoA hydratase-related protein [Myxococcota bacterium]